MQGMSKLIGGFLGFLLAGSSGGLLGILIGHLFDQHLNTLKNQYDFQQETPETLQDNEFLSAIFIVMGYLAKIDGTVSKQSIENAYLVMDQFGLNRIERLQAIQLFEQGKHARVDLQKVIKRFVLANYYNPIRLKQFLEIQLKAARVDGSLSHKKKQAFEMIYRLLNFRSFEGFDALFETMYKNYREHSQNHHTYHNSYTKDTDELSKAYVTLGVAQNASHEKIKQAYRRLMNQYHPDKFASQNLSTAELEKKKTKLHQVQIAYAKICNARGFKK